MSDHGRVRSLPRVVEVLNRWGTTTRRRFPGVVLSPCINTARSDRRYVTLHDSGEQYSRLVSNLVAAAFLGPRPDGLQVCHNNGRATDDRAANLRYDTPTGNAADCVLHGTRKRGEQHPAARLGATEVLSIREQAAQGAKHKDLARAFSVHPNYVSLIVTRARWAPV